MTRDKTATGGIDTKIPVDFGRQLKTDCGKALTGALEVSLYI